MQDYVAIVVTPVKNSIETVLAAAKAIASSNVKVKHIIYDDFSEEDTVQTLKKYQSTLGYEFVSLSDLTDHPSPNYKLVLELSQERALLEKLPLIIVESDVIIRQDTISAMLNVLQDHPFAGLIGAVTVDNEGEINFPYLKFKGLQGQVVKTDRSLSFCCTLLSNSFLSTYNFQDLNPDKNWFDVFISHKSTEMGFQNFILLNTTVVHQPHGSRPWKQLKYKNPFKYYFLKYWKGLDKI